MPIPTFASLNLRGKLFHLGLCKQLFLIFSKKVMDSSFCCSI